MYYIKTFKTDSGMRPFGRYRRGWEDIKTDLQEIRVD
jgi:hypothetical protein